MFRLNQQVLVELLAATKPQPGMPLPDISKDAIERFLQWTPGEDKRRIALLAAIPRQFNLDILSVVIGKDATDLFNWLSSQSYVRTDSERGWFYHEKIRDLMVRYLKNTFPSELLSAHQKLAEFFALENSKLNLKDCPFAEIKMTFANFCQKRSSLPPISLNRAKNRRGFPHPRLVFQLRRRATTKYGIPGNLHPIFGD